MYNCLEIVEAQGVTQLSQLQQAFSASTIFCDMDYALGIRPSG